MSEIDLQKFCGDEPYRPYLLKPFSQGEWTYATNGHICVRVPRIEGAATPDNAPNAAALFVGVTTPCDMALPKIKIPKGPTEKIECSDCEGSGHVHECPDCQCECDGCDGTGKCWPREDVSVELAGNPFAARYVRLLYELPNVRIPSKEKHGAPMPFKFDGGEGVLMGTSRPLKKHITP